MPAVHVNRLVSDFDRLGTDAVVAMADQLRVALPILAKFGISADEVRAVVPGLGLPRRVSSAFLEAIDLANS